MKKPVLLFAWCIFAANIAQAGDMAETSDVVKSPDISYSNDPFAGVDPITGVIRKKTTPAVNSEAMLRQQQDAARMQAAQQTYQQNQDTAARGTPTTLEIPAGTISGINAAITVTTGQ